MPTVNKIELTRILKITPPTLSEWMARHGSDFPIVQVGGPGRDWIFDLEAVLTFLAARDEEKRLTEEGRRSEIEQLLLPLGHNGGPPLEPDRSPLRPAELLTLMKVRRLQREEAELCGRLVEVDEIREGLREVFGVFGRALQTSVTNAADEMALSPEQRDLLLVRVRQAQRNAVAAAKRHMTLKAGSAAEKLPGGSAEGPQNQQDLLSSAAE